MRIWRAAVPSLVLVMAGCSAADTVATTSTTRPDVATTPAPTTTLRLVPGCAEEGGFTEGGHVATFDQASSDSDTIGLISWDVVEACETFTITFETSEGAPATTPPSVDVDYLDGTPVIRIALDADSTVITDQLVETHLIDRLYVVRALDGGMFIDLYLAAPAQAHVEVRTSPARLVLNLQPGIVEYPTPVAISGVSVVVAPLDGALVTGETHVAGYTRTFESNVLIIATSGDEVVAEEQTTAADSLQTWGEFRATLVLPLGDVSLFVGDESAEDGSLEGVTIDLAVGE